MKRNLGVAAAVMVGLLGFFGSAQAQSITGVAKDSSGAVLPGVSVQVWSDTSRATPVTAVTNREGAYHVSALVTGIYHVTFTLTGFRTVTKKNLNLSSGIAIAVNATMDVGIMDESWDICPVSSVSPLVDTQSNVTSYVISRDLLDALPTDHTLSSISLLVPGVIVSSPDHPVLSVHGSPASDTVLTIDGMIVSALQD